LGLSLALDVECRWQSFDGRNLPRLLKWSGAGSQVGQLEKAGAEKEHDMSGTLINLIIQIIAGVIGGHAAGATLKNYTLGAVGNTIAGAIGGAVGG
jgi:hypothetical protein